MIFPELANLRGISRVIEVDEFGKALGKPDEVCKFVVLANWTTDDSLSNNLTVPKDSNFVAESSQTEIYYGYDKSFAHQLFAGRETNYLPCQNLAQISVRARKGQTRKLFFTFFI